MRKSPKPDVETLQSDKRYSLVYELGFHEMLPFVLTQIKRKGLFSWLYLFINIAMLVFIVLLSISLLLDHSLGWKHFLFQAALGGMAGSILLIPVHELIHGLAYRILGVDKIHFGADLQQFIFYVTANRYPVSGKEVHFLTLSPFVIINLITLVLTLTLIPKWTLFSACFLLSHNIMCIGDFAISNFVSKTGKKVYTYDETKTKMSYFYVET